ncbi:hypothetical protein FRC07_008210, partial [Ceratobasidium sp. 392]
MATRNISSSPAANPSVLDTVKPGAPSVDNSFALSFESASSATTAGVPQVCSKSGAMKVETNIWSATSGATPTVASASDALLEPEARQQATRESSGC